MTTKHISSIIQHHWKTFFLILSILIGVILIFPAVRFFPTLIDIALVFSGKNEIFTASTGIELHTNGFQDQSFTVFLPLIESNVKQNENRSHKNKASNKFHLIDTSPDGAQIIIQIKTRENLVHSGSLVEIAFLPGEQCNFGDGQACTYNFFLANENRVIISSIHSGIGGEGEGFRNLIEGTGINQALYTSDQVTKIIQSLIGSQVIIQQGDTEITDITLAAVVRIPPNEIDTYLSLPIEQTLAYAQEISGLNSDLLNQDLFIIETCGWRLDDEDKSMDYPNTMGSIYLGILH